MTVLMGNPVGQVRETLRAIRSEDDFGKLMGAALAGQPVKPAEASVVRHRAAKRARLFRAFLPRRSSRLNARSV